MKILQLTDMHFNSYPFNKKDQKTSELITRLVKKEEPDLLVVSGDLISGYMTTTGLIVFQGVVNFLDELGVKIAITYGNHDSEANYLIQKIENIKAKFENEEEVLNHIKRESPELLYIYENYETVNPYTREDLNQIVAKMENHVDKEGLESSSGKEMYHIDINSSTRILIVDSGDYGENGISFYESLDFVQQEWIIKNASEKEKTSHLFIHIPLPEYKLARQAGLAEGHQDETECSADYNTGTWSRLKFQTNVKAVYCGHDHNNDYSADYHGVQLNYGRVTGYNCYGELKRGARIIQIDGKKFKTNITSI